EGWADGTSRLRGRLRDWPELSVRQLMYMQLTCTNSRGSGAVVPSGPGTADHGCMARRDLSFVETRGKYAQARAISGPCCRTIGGIRPRPAHLTEACREPLVPHH